MNNDNLIVIAIAFCFCVFVGTIGSCTYASGVDYNKCVVNSTVENAQYCKVTR